VGITHCKAHQTDSSIITRGNNQASSPPNCTPIGHVPPYPSFLLPLLNTLSPLLKLKLFSPIYIRFFILIFMFFTPFSSNPFPYLWETYIP
jgi:hypothetical protein